MLPITIPLLKAYRPSVLDVVLLICSLFKRTAVSKPVITVIANKGMITIGIFLSAYIANIANIERNNNIVDINNKIVTASKFLRGTLHM